MGRKINPWYSVHCILMIVETKQRMLCTILTLSAAPARLCRAGARHSLALYILVVL